MSHRGEKGSQGEPARSKRAGAIWKAVSFHIRLATVTELGNSLLSDDSPIGKRQGKDEGEPLAEMKYTPKPSHAERV